MQCIFDIPQALFSFFSFLVYFVKTKVHISSECFSLSRCLLRRFSVYCWLLAGVTQGMLQIISNAKTQKLNISINVKSTYHIGNSSFSKDLKLSNKVVNGYRHLVSEHYLGLLKNYVIITSKKKKNCVGVGIQPFIAWVEEGGSDDFVNANTSKSGRW